MKTSYSLVLGEYLEAKEIDYDDTRRLQTVCPCCHEAVFKGIFSQKNTHYFSHFKKDELMNSDCEIRVKGLSKAFKAVNAKARGQRLSKFMSVFEEVMKTHYFQWNDQEAKRFMKGHCFKTVMYMTLYSATGKTPKPIPFTPNVLLMKDQFLLVAHQFLENTENYEEVTSLGRETNKRLALELFLHLITPQVRKNLELLYLVSYVDKMISLERQQSTLDRDSENFFIALTQIPEIGKKISFDYLYTLQSMELPSFEMTFLMAIVRSIAFHMVQILLEFPFERCIKREVNHELA